MVDQDILLTTKQGFFYTLKVAHPPHLLLVFTFGGNVLLNSAKTLKSPLYFFYMHPDYGLNKPLPLNKVVLKRYKFPEGLIELL